MKTLIALVLIAALAGCGSTPRVDTVIKTQYVVRTAPAELKQLPAYPRSLNPTTASQSDLAQWLVDNEDYMLEIERKFKALIGFYEAPVVPPKEEPKK